MASENSQAATQVSRVSEALEEQLRVVHQISPTGENDIGRCPHMAAVPDDDHLLVVSNFISDMKRSLIWFISYLDPTLGQIKHEPYKRAPTHEAGRPQAHIVE